MEVAGECYNNALMKITSLEGSIASSIAKHTGCGSIKSPWKIDVLPGQSVTLTYDNSLHEQMGSNGLTETCIALG